MKYHSTRGNDRLYSSAEAIIAGLCEDGGLFVPSDFPTLDVKNLCNMPYDRIAYNVLKLFLTDYDDDFLTKTTNEVYMDSRFNNRAGHVTRVSERLSFLELWHGPTYAFKDYALQILPRLLVEAKRMTGYNKTNLVLVATSGDTGSAALYGFGDLPGIKVIAMYPENGVSMVQRRQMTEAKGDNLAVFGVEGNFDDIQTAVKNIFSNDEISRKLADIDVELCSANSINFGRLVPQICYYFSNYAEMLAEGVFNEGETVDYVVPTGNFGDILAGYYAKRMGLPIGKLVCASNKNRILTDFFTTGIYDTRREFFKTGSPSMDILISSNLERLLYHISGDCEYVASLMSDLKTNGLFMVSKEMLAEMQEIFFAGYADDDLAQSTIRSVYERYDYLCDPHTAVAAAVAKKWNETKLSSRQMVILSTANPYKFPSEIVQAFHDGLSVEDKTALSMLKGAFPESPMPTIIDDMMRSEGKIAPIISIDNTADSVIRFAGLR